MIDLESGLGWGHSHGQVRKPENNGKKVAIIEWLEKEERFKAGTTKLQGLL